MPFQPVPFTAQADFMFSYLGNPMQNSMHFQFAAGLYVESDLQNLADSLDSLISTFYKPLVSIGVLYDRVEVRGLNSEFDLVVSSVISAGAGAAVTALQPLNVAKCISIRSDFTGRSARGRFYSIGMVESQVASTKTVVTTVYETALLLLLASIRTGVGADGWFGVITSRFHNLVKRPVGVNFVWTHEISVNRTTDSMRGRLPASG